MIRNEGNEEIITTALTATTTTTNNNNNNNNNNDDDGDDGDDNNENNHNHNPYQPEITSSSQNHFEVDRTSKSTITIQTLQTPPLPDMTKENCLSDEVIQSAENNTFSGDHTITNLE